MVGVGLDADVDVLELRVLLPDVVGVVCDHQGDVQVVAQGDQTVIDDLQFGHILVLLEFQEVAVTEDFPVPAGGPSGLVHVFLGQQLGHLC